MFAGLTAAIGPPTPADHTPRREYPPTPIKFPQFNPQASDPVLHPDIPLVSLLQKIQRPADIKPHHFAALGINITPDAPAASLLPDASFLPPSAAWIALPAEELQAANESTRRPLSNGNLSPGVQTYRERLKELQITNLSAFRTIRRIPAPAGETPARLGNAYEFYKNLEFFSSYWPDTSLESAPEIDENVPPHQQTHVRTGTGSQLPPDYRQNLLSAFVKLVAYDFGCNVSFPRTEPRLHLTPPEPAPPSYFNSSVTFIYRTPTDRISARGGVVEGPVATLSSRSTTGFATTLDEQLDVAREIVAVLLTAQQRAREHKAEGRFGEGKWWACKPRWGGGPGGPIGKEGDKIEAMALAALASTKDKQATDLSTSTSSPSTGGNGTSSPSAASSKPNTESRVIMEAKRQLSAISSPHHLPSSNHNTHTSSSPPIRPSPSSSVITSSSPSLSSNKRPKKDKDPTHHPAYDMYRKMLPPSPTWDRKARYSAIGRVPGASYDDIFLISCLNHHVSVLRARVPLSMLSEIDGSAAEGGREGRGGVQLFRSKWFDLFRPEERVQAMDLVWGVMGWLMRKVEAKSDGQQREVAHPHLHSNLKHSMHDTHRGSPDAAGGSGSAGGVGGAKEREKVPSGTGGEVAAEAGVGGEKMDLS